jgi:Flp pilus assembly protein TadG
MNRKNQSGQALVTTAIALVVLAGFAGLALDMGTLRYQKRLQQSAADAAAIAGASNVAYSGIQAGAQAAAAANGFADNTGGGSCADSNNTAVGSITVTICNGPSDRTLNGVSIAGGPHAGNTNYVEALVTVVHPTYFMNLFGVNSETITTRAVATNTGGGAAGGAGCIYTLGTPTKKIQASTAGISSSGSVILNAPTCGIVDNGNFVANGGKNLDVNAGSIGVGGSYSGPGCGVGSGVCPVPVTGMPYSGDPFSGKYPIPTYGASSGPIKITAGSCTGAGCAGNVTCVSGTCSVAAGTYDDLCIDNNQKVNFSAGLYVITGASTCSNNVEFQINAGSTVCNSANADCSGMVASQNAGVTFYMTGSASVNVNGTAQVQLAAPNSGTYEGLLFYQDPSDTAAATLSGNSTSLYQGAIYMPTADLTFGGNTNFNNGAAYTVIVVDQLNFAGNPDVNLKSNFSGLANGGGPLAGVTEWAQLVE